MRRRAWMRQVLLPAGALALGAARAASPGEAPLAPTDAAPAPGELRALSLPDAAGRLRPLHDGAAVLTLVDFWASWCAPCRLSFPWMDRLHAAHAGAGLRIVAVNLDARRADADAFLARHAPRFEVLFDPAAGTARRFAVRAMPSARALDAGGRLLWAHAGFRTSDAAGLEARIRHALQQPNTGPRP